MKPIRLRWRWLSGLLLLAAGGLLGCETDPQNRPDHPPRDSARPTASRKPADASSQPAQAAGAKRTPLGKEVWLETQGERRRLLIGATVCLREGSYGLECLLCRNGTKEHESVLTTPANGQLIHAGLLAARATPGSPVRYEEKKGETVVIPPSGTRIKITLEYEDQGRRIRVPAQDWIRDAKTRKHLDNDWVFAGSVLVPNPDGEKKPPVYAANFDGAYICTTNVPTALLALPINSSNRPEERTFEPYTEHIPPIDTKVILILEPLAEDKKPAPRRAEPNR